jgi:membrane protein required for colicin V production
MNWLDFLFCGILIFCIYRSFKQGFIKEALPLVSIVIALIVASHFYLNVAKLLKEIFPHTTWHKIAGFLVVFAVTVTVLFIIGMLIRKVLGILFMGWLDKLGGIVLGFAKACVIIAIIIIVLLKFPIGESKQWVKGSIIARYSQVPVRVLLPLLPNDFFVVVTKHLNHMKSKFCTPKEK